MVDVPAAERDVGLAAYLTTTPGIGGRLRAESEDFQVIELGPGPPADEKGKFTAARIRLRNWETNRFVGVAAKEMGIKRGHVAFAGMKDKRAVTEQWFTFQCPADRLEALERLDDVWVLEHRRARERAYGGSHTGNRFVLRVREHAGTQDIVAQAAQQIAAQQGVPNFFGPQRFGSSFRPLTHHIGRAIVDGDLQEAVRLFCGNPVEGEREEAKAARTIYEETGDAAAAHEAFPRPLDPERSVLKRLSQRPDNYRNAIKALPKNLLQLFVHAHQSYLFNRILSARLEAGLGLAAAHEGDRVMAHDEDGTHTVPVTAANRARVQEELDKGRATLTAPLPGTATPMAEGDPGAIEARVLEEERIDVAAFRCRELPEVASVGRRRGIVQPVRDLELGWTDGDPVVSFGLGKGAYATVVMREIMKAGPEAY